MVVERKHGLSTEPVPVSAYVGSSKNLKDLKDGGRVRRRAEGPLDEAKPLLVKRHRALVVKDRLRVGGGMVAVLYDQ